ncbi:MAG: NifB/NifX family molybdenum-iron cluster-binding protein [Thermacetogeniaceae bacterium]
MAFKIAVASSDHKFVNQHFGHARQFLIYEIESENFKYIETRTTDPLCGDQEHDEDRLSRITKLLSDCQAVLVAKIGPGALEKLQLQGVKAYVVPQFIDDALRTLISSDKLG